MPSFLDRLKSPFRLLDKKITEDIAAKAAVAVRAALLEAPLLDSLLDGEEVVLHVQADVKMKLSKGNV